MGFDVTFHPVSENEIRHFIFDVLKSPRLAEARLKELKPKGKSRDLLVDLYRAFPEWIAHPKFAVQNFSFMAAIVAGYLHSYWYARNFAITFVAEKEMPELQKVFVPLDRLKGSPLANLPTPARPMIRGNDSASGFVPSTKIKLVQDALNNLAEKHGGDGSNNPGLKSLHAALVFCRNEKLGLIEASDIAVPISGRCLSRASNLKGLGGL